MRAWLTILIVIFSATSVAAQVPKVTVVPVVRTNVTVTGQPIVVPDRPDVLVSIATFPPGARLPVHKHLYPHLVYVLEGDLTVTNTQTGKTFAAKAGTFVAEMQNTWHFGVNEGRVPVKLLIIDEVPRGTASNVLPKK
jgi:quercetin dioxygenase-like cupin family protein